MSGHLDGPPPGPPDPPYIPGDLGAPSAKEFARRRAGDRHMSDNPYPNASDTMHYELHTAWDEGYAEGFAAGRAAATPDPPDAADLVAAHLRERWPCTCRPGMDGGGVYHAADCNSRREGSQAVLAVIRLLRAATPPASPDERLQEALAFYADENNWLDGSPGRWEPVGVAAAIDYYGSADTPEFEHDHGEVARAALAEVSAEAAPDETDPPGTVDAPSVADQSPADERFTPPGDATRVSRGLVPPGIDLDGDAIRADERERLSARVYENGWCPTCAASAAASPADERLREAAQLALDHLDSYLRGESGLAFVEPYPAARNAATVLVAALAGVSAEAAPERPEFTFRTSSHSPRWTVTCKSCGWRVEGDDPGTFAQADAHECGAEAAPGDAPDETDADDAADAPSVADQYPISDSEFIEPPFGVDTPPPNPSPDGTTRYARRGFGIASGAPPVMSNMRAPEPEGDNPAITPPSNPYPFHEPLRVEHHSDEDKRQAWDEGYAAGVVAGRSIPSTGTGWDRGYAAGLAARDTNEPKDER